MAQASTMTRFTLKTPRAGDHAPSTPTHMSAVHDPRLDRIWDLQQACSALRMGLPLLEERIELLRAVVAEGAVFGPGNTCFDVSLAQHQYDLGVALYERFVHVHEINNLVEAETHLRLALPTWPFGSSSVEPCSVLGSVLRELAFETSNRSLSEEALALHRQPFLVKSDIPALEGACHCRELGLTLRVNYLVNLDQEQYLLESIQHLEAAEAQFAAMAITDHACSAGLILARTDLHTAHMDKARLTENSIISDLALAQCGPDHRDFYQVLWSATMVHRAAAWFCDDAAPLFGTIDVLRDVLADSPSGWVTVFTCELVQALRFRFVREGGEEDLSEAITRVTRLLEGSSADAPQWDKLQGCLADVLYLRFRMNGAASDIENAVRAAELALSRTGIGTGAYYLRLCRFALCREAQYRAFGDIAHLNEGVELHGQVVSLAPSSSGARLVAEQNLLAALGLRAGATASLDDLNRAIELVPHSTTSLVFDHAEAATLLHEIGKVFLMRFEMTASLDDLENATTWHRAAVQRCEITSPHIYDHHNVINAYSTVLRIRFQVLGETDSIAMALKQQKQLANALPVAHAGRTAVLCVLAQILICADPAQDEVAEALNHLQDALNNDYCPAYSRLKDVGNVLMYFTEEHVPHLSSENALTLSTVYSKAIALLPHVASFGLEQRTRLAVIANSGRLTTQAASRAISVGQHELALEMLEAGRSVFWTQGLHLRAPFVDLPVEIGGRLTKITAALGQPMPVSAAAGPAKERELARRRRLGDEFVVVLDEARRLPGFEDLLQNTSFASLAQAARQNPIVVLVAGENVGHAIIILENAQVVLVALEKVNNAPLKALSHSIEMHSRNVRSRGIRKVQATEAHGSSDMYRELWTLIMAPIVNALGWPKAQGRGRRRLVLCPTGVFMQLPLHAAGIYTGDGQVCCSDYFVATYVPSIGALLHAQQSFKPVRRVHADTLIVAVENPFEGQALPLTSKEAGVVHDYVSPSAKVVQVAGSEDVLENIRSASILHMACHGTQNLPDALQSGFFLEDELLPVSKLMQLELPNAFLAVLSACETAKGDASQPDQAIHLAATMLFAGFKSVVATMWFMRDLEGPDVADSIYSALFHDDDSEYLDPDDVPYALDDAVRKMRESGLDPSFWATYVHIGT